MKEIKLNIKYNSQNLPEGVVDDIDDLSYNGIVVNTKNDDLPLPWDASLYLEEDSLVIEGSAGPNGYGYALIKMPIDKISPYLVIYVEPKDEDSAERLTDIFKQYGWL